MLTKVYLDGPLGQEFGREWEFEVNSPHEALLMIDANKPGLIAWVKRYSSKYAHYQVVVEYEDGKTEDLSDESFEFKRKMKSVRFVPLIQGSGKWITAIVAVVIIIVGCILSYFGLGVIGVPMIEWGVNMLAVSVIVALTTKSPKKREADIAGRSGLSLFSTAFGDSGKTTYQGLPVPVIYGRNLVGSQVISAGVFIS